MHYSFAGTVIDGKKLGRKLGFPTANIAIDEAAGADDGVYAAHITVDGCQYEGMANLGRRPTVDDPGGKRLLEVNIFGLEADIYGKYIIVMLLQHIRPEKRFASMEELKASVENDRRVIKEYFKELQESV